MKPEDIPNIIEQLDTGSFDLRLALAEKLAALGEPAVPYLIQALKSDRWMVRQDSADILGRIGSPSALDALRQLLSDPEPGVKACARDAIDAIEGNAKE